MRAMLRMLLLAATLVLPVVAAGAGETITVYKDAT